MPLSGIRERDPQTGDRRATERTHRVDRLALSDASMPERRRGAHHARPDRHDGDVRLRDPHGGEQPRVQVHRLVLSAERLSARDGRIDETRLDASGHQVGKAKASAA